MFRQPDESPEDQALRRGLRSLPIPEPSADFDARVRAALRCPTPWWQTLWQVVWGASRSVLPAAACSCVAMLGFLHWSTGTPVALPGVLPPQNLDTIASARGQARMNALDHEIEGMDASSSTLSAIAVPIKKPATGKATRKPASDSRHSAPEQRSQLDTPPAA